MDRFKRPTWSAVGAWTRRALPVCVAGLIAPALAAAQGGQSASASSSARSSASQLTLWGIVDTSYYRRHLAGAPAVHNLDGGTLSVSRWGMRGSEDLGGGTSAIFELTGHFRPGTGEVGRHPGDSAAGRLFSQASWLGVRGPFGQFRMGRIPSMSFVNGVRFSPWNRSTALGTFLMHSYAGGQPMLSPHSGADGIWNGVLAYASPTLAGWVGTLHLRPRSQSQEGRRAEASAVYIGQRFRMALGHVNVRRAGYAMPRTPTDVQGMPYVIRTLHSTSAHADYDFGFSKLVVQLSQSRLSPAGLAGIRLRILSVGATVPYGVGRFVISAAHTGRRQDGVANKTRSTLTAGYIHAMSKRTDLYAFSIADRATGLDSGVGWGVGIHHQF